MSKVFKVISRLEGKLYSYLLGGIEYRLHSWTVPKVGYLFVFDTLANAERFYRLNDDVAVLNLYEAEADKIYPPVRNDLVLGMEEFWKDYHAHQHIFKQGDYNHNYPKGTLWTNKLMLTSKVL
jgi:hypothetical protein